MTLRLLAASSVIAISTVWTGGAAAQSQAVTQEQNGRSAAVESEAEERETTNTIVVTARFQQESLQDTPISITALSGDDLAARGIDGVEGIGRSAPNVTLEQNTAGYGKSVLAYIRGVGQSDFLPSFEPGVGIYIDDVYQGTLFGSLFDFADVAQVEVLRGPQGTLFGKNNQGGAIRVSTQRARGDNSGYIEAGLGSFDRMTMRGAFDFSVVPDKVFLRVAGGFNKVDGHVERIDFVCANPSLAGDIPRQVPQNSDNSCFNGTLGGQETYSFRGNLRILPTDNLEININADLLEDKGEPGPEELLVVNNDGTSPLALYQEGSPFGTNPTGFGDGIYFDNRFLTPDRYTTYTNFSDPRFELDFPPVSEVRSWGVSGQINWSVTPDVEVTSITAYRAYEGRFIQNWGHSPIHINDNFFEPEHWQFTQEARVNASVTDFLDLTVGGYYFKGYTELNSYVSIPIVGFAFYGEDPVRDEDKSAFLHALIRPLDGLSLEAGIRYSDVSKEYEFNRLIPGTGNPPASLPGFENDPVVLSTTDRLDYRLSAQYEVSPDVMVFGSFATGFKGPGVNPRPATSDELLPFAEEELEAFEIGVKTELFNGRLTANIAAYQSNYTDLQLTVTRALPSGVPGSITANAGEARIRGLEAEFSAEPVDDLFLNATLGYLDFEYIDLGDAANQPGGPCITCVAPYVPEWSLAAGAQYRVDLGGNGSLTPRLDWYYKSKTYNDVSNFELGAIDGYDILNGRITYENENGDWSVSMQVNNITDRYYFVNKFQGYFALGTIVGQTAQPRTFLLSVRHEFD